MDRYILCTLHSLMIWQQVAEQQRLVLLINPFTGSQCPLLIYLKYLPGLNFIYLANQLIIDNPVAQQPSSGNQDPTKGFRSPCDLHVDVNRKVSLWQGDITQLQVDAIVNDAKRNLSGGDDRIHELAGVFLKNAATTMQALCQVGQAQMTGGFLLPALHVIHTVPLKQRNYKNLCECYRSNLQLCGG